MRDTAELADGVRRPEVWPTSLVGHLVAALSARRASGAGPFTVLSLEDVPRNGDRARRAVLDVAEQTDMSLAEWISERVSFPNSVSDLSVAAVTDETREVLRTDFGLDDLWPIEVRGDTTWVVEDKFCAGRPPLEDAGVQLVAEISEAEHLRLTGRRAVSTPPEARALSQRRR